MGDSRPVLGGAPDHQGRWILSLQLTLQPEDNSTFAGARGNKGRQNPPPALSGRRRAAPALRPYILPISPVQEKVRENL